MYWSKFTFERLEDYLGVSDRVVWADASYPTYIGLKITFSIGIHMNILMWSMLLEYVLHVIIDFYYVS